MDNFKEKKSDDILEKLVPNSIERGKNYSPWR